MFHDQYGLSTLPYSTYRMSFKSKIFDQVQYFTIKFRRRFNAANNPAIQVLIRGLDQGFKGIKLVGGESIEKLIGKWAYDQVGFAKTAMPSAELDTS